MGMIAGRRVIGFHAMMSERRRALPGACECWDCLRADGITPNRGAVDKHPDKLGRVHTANGIPAPVELVELQADELAA